MTAEARQILKARFGYENFRLNQEAVVNSVLQRRDTFVLMPTGGGKSLCYQIPALLFDGLTVVISPLIALMKDQVDSLRLNGVPAAYLNSTLSYSEQQEILQQLSANKLKLLYLAPERLLRTEGSDFISFLKQQRISLLAIDEAHCISEWGHDFRPEYRMLSKLKQAFGDVPVIALTATADQLTRKDILERLELRNPAVFVSSFNRPNIRYNVEPKRNSFDRLLQFLKEHSNDSGIIYCLSRGAVEKLAEDLQAEGYNVLPYHAGLEKDVRARHQELFLKDEVKIITATIAFGMGIDKSNVRFVVHMDLPKSVEGYYQETGRAGRDGLNSEALLFYSAGDVMKLRNFATVEGNDAQTQVNLQKLDKMARYGVINTCRRRYLLRYFDEEAPDHCGACDICLSTVDRFDGTIVAQKIMSAVARLQEKFGAAYVIDILRGSASAKIREEHKRLPTYGVGADVSKEVWQQYIQELITLGYLSKSEGQYPLLQLNERSYAILRKQETVMLTQRRVQIAVEAPRGAVPYEAELFEKLKIVRRKLAAEENVPAYIILSDASLIELAAYLPHGREELRRISGLGDVKIEKYGQEFQEVVTTYCRLKQLSSRMELKRTASSRKVRKETLTDTKEQTLTLYRQGKTLFEIARVRDLGVSTVEAHLAYFVGRGDLRVDEFVSPAKMARIRDALSRLGHAPLSPIKEALGADVSYGEIKIMIAHLESARV